MKDTTAIILCAGSASRMNGIDKINAKINGIPVMEMSIRAFLASDNISDAIVVVRESELEKCRKKYAGLFDKPVIFVCGGSTRQRSASAALAVLPENTRFIAIHDGARPLVSVKVIDAAIDGAHRFGASMAGVPVKDTIKQCAENGMILSTPLRSSLREAQTPQVFERGLYLNAFAQAAESGADYTDDSQLAEAFGAKVYVTEGDFRNIKITTPEDILLAEALEAAK